MTDQTDTEAAEIAATLTVAAFAAYEAAMRAAIEQRDVATSDAAHAAYDRAERAFRSAFHAAGGRSRTALAKGIDGALNTAKDQGDDHDERTKPRTRRSDRQQSQPSRPDRHHR